MDSFVFFFNIFPQLPRLCGLDVTNAYRCVCEQRRKLELETRTPLTNLCPEEGQGADYSTSLETQVCHLLTAAHSARCKFRSFKVEELFFEQHDVLSISTSSEFNQCQLSGFFAGLNYLTLCIDPITNGAPTTMWCQDKIKRMVILATLAQNLET